MSTQTHLDVAQAFAPAQLSERHAQKLIQAREAFDVAIATVLGDGAAKLVQWQMPHQLREHIAALMHVDVLGKRTSTLAESPLKSMTLQNSRQSTSTQSLARD
jgi:hypothetical protein